MSIMKFESLLIIILVIIQLYVFITVWRKIIQFKKFFPESFHSVNIKKVVISKRIINDNEKFEKFIKESSNNKQILFEEGDDLEETELLVISESIRSKHLEFDGSSPYLVG